MEISAGNLIAIIGILLNVLAMVGGGYAALTRIDGRLQLLTKTHDGFADRLNKVDARLELFGSSIVTIAKQEERMSAQDQRMNFIAQRFDSFAEEMKERIKGIEDKIDNLPSPSKRKRA